MDIASSYLWSIQARWVERTDRWIRFRYRGGVYDCLPALSSTSLCGGCDHGNRSVGVGSELGRSPSNAHSLARKRAVAYFGAFIYTPQSSLVDTAADAALGKSSRRICFGNRLADGVPDRRRVGCCFWVQ